MTGLPQSVCRTSLGASYGDAFLARVAIGGAAPGDIADWNPVIREVAPQGAPALARAYPLFRRLYEQTRDIARDLG